MCRECGPNYRRCPSSYGEGRAARERAKYGAGKAAAASVPKQAHPGLVRSDTHETATASVPTVEHIQAEIARLSAAMNAPHALDSDRAAIVAEFGSTEAAVRHVGDLIAQRAEHHAGITIDDVAAVQGDSNAAHLAAAAKVEAEYGMAERRRELDAAKRAVSRGTLAERAAATVAYNEKVDEWNKIVRSKEYKAAQRAAKDALNGKGGASGDLLVKFRDGYVQALSEVRPLGGELKLSDSTKKSARLAFQEAADYYPADWVRRSNEGKNLNASVVTTRAHYTDGGDKKRVKEPMWGFRQHFPVSEDPNDVAHPENDSMYRWVKSPDSDLSSDPGMAEWRPIRQQTVYRRNGDEPKPSGNGWSEYSDKQGRKYWRRDRTKMKEHIDYGSAEIRTNKGSNLDGRSETYAIATHEMAHRFEATVPDIRRIENEFLRRRTTMSDGNRERRVNVSPGLRKPEMGWADSFVDAYVGRDYQVARQDIAGHPDTEVLSMGIEALYGGNHGGLVGAGRYKADPEHRALILGMLALAGRR